MLARFSLIGLLTLLGTTSRFEGASANPFGPLTLRYTRAVVPGGQVLCEWSSWIFLPKDYVQIVLITDDIGYEQAENKLVPASQIDAKYVGDFHLTRNDGRFELPIPFGIQSNQRYRVAIGESNKTPYGRPAKLLLSRSFFIGRQPSSVEQEQSRRAGGSSSYGGPTVGSNAHLSINEPSSSLYVASEPVPVRWENESKSSRGTVLIKVLKQTDPGAWTEVGFFRMPNIGAVDLELTPGACRGTFIIEISPENNPQGFARSPEFDFDTDSNSYTSPDRACAVEPHMLKGDRSQENEAEGEDDDSSGTSGIRRWWNEWKSNITSWDPTTLEIVYLMAGCLAFLTLVVALSCCCCPCCVRRKRQRGLVGPSDLRVNTYGVEGRPQYYVTQQSHSGPCQQTALSHQQRTPGPDAAPTPITRSGSVPSLVEQHQTHPLNEEPEPSPGVEPSAPPYSMLARRSFTFSDRGGATPGENHTILV